MSARDLALIQLDDRLLPNWPRGIVRPQHAHAITQARDFALAEQILNGVLKNVLLLQHLTEHYSGRPLRKIDPLAQKVIAIALYQMRFLDRIPASAAVDEAVEQMKRFGQRGAAGFVNAVLRNASREPSPPLPSREKDPAAYAERVLSHPQAFYARLEKLLGPADALSFCEHDNREPPTLARLMGGADLEALRQDLPEGVTLEPHEQPGLFAVHGAKRALFAAWATRGLAQVQDATAAAVALRCQLAPGQIVLDRCSGLGTKTLQMHELMQGQGRLVAMDPNAERSGTLRGLISERCLANIEVHESPWLKDLPALAGVRFDRVLVDAPCSNSGVLARRPEARFTQSVAATKSLVKLQRDILRDTAGHVAPGGLLIYSTCSVWPEENQQRVTDLVKTAGDFEPVEERFTLPSFGLNAAEYHDGGYFALLRRRA